MRTMDISAPNMRVKAAVSSPCQIAIFFDRSRTTSQAASFHANLSRAEPFDNAPRPWRLQSCLSPRISVQALF
jgi:hypothetical protein